MPHPLLLRSVWPIPVADGYGRAFDFHLTTFAGWLNRSGAEARLALVLCSGPGARDRFVESIGIDRIEVVHAPARPEQPVDPRITAHAGSHFNNTLFVVDGLDPSRPALFEALDGRVGLLARTATWVALVVDSLAALQALYIHAPRLAARVMRRCLVLDGHVADAKSAPLPDALRDRWWAAAHTAERIYHEALTAGHPPALVDFDRLARTGYLPALVGRVMHPERQRLCALWNAGPDARALPFTAEQAGPVVAEAALRRAKGSLDDDMRDALQGRLDARSRIGTDGRLPTGALNDLRAVRAMGEGTAEVDAAAVARLRAAADALDPWLSAHAHEALAAAAAAEGDLEACAAGLARTVKTAEAVGLPEMAFEAIEKQVKIAVFGDRLGEAKTKLQALEALAPLLHSPFYAGRARLARGEFVAPLDPARAALELQAAERLFRAHGYPTWAATARESMP